MKRSLAAAAALSAFFAAAPAGAAPVSRQAAADRAQRDVATRPAAVAGGPGQAFQVRAVQSDADGTTHVHLDRTYQGLDVLGGDVIVHDAANGAFKSADSTLDAAPAVATAPAVTGARAAALAGAGASAPRRLVVEARVGAPRLAWLLTIAGTKADGTPSRVLRTIDARTGALLASEETIETAGGSGRGLYVGRTTPVPLDTTATGGGFVLTDPNRGNGETRDTMNRTDRCGLFRCTYAATDQYVDADNAWGTGLNTNRQTAAVDVHFGSEKTWDFYQSQFGRNGIAGDGKGALSRVHYGRNYNNAFWDDACFCMTYGDGDGTVFGPLTALDVTGHEMSHGVTSHTAKLNYFGESGGLNEATSDIFGTMIEFYANDPDDPPDYNIGEEVVKTGTALRSMAQPSRDGSSADCWGPFVGFRDVHFSSGVANHFFYLLSQGSGTGPYDTSTTCNGAPAVTGIGNAAAQRIWYRALTVYMTSTTNYKRARAATLSAAQDEFPGDPTKPAAVAAAWTAVNVK